MIFPLSFIHAPCFLSYSRWDVGAQSQSQEIPQGNFLLFLFFSYCSKTKTKAIIQVGEKKKKICSQTDLFHLWGERARRYDSVKFMCRFQRNHRCTRLKQYVVHSQKLKERSQRESGASVDGRKLSIWQTGSCCCGSSQQLFCSLPLTARDKWPLKSHDHLIHRSLAVNCALKLLAGTQR